MADNDDLKCLASLLAKYAPHDGAFTIGSTGLGVSRYSKTNAEKIAVFSHPSLCIVPQGAKFVSLAQGEFEYDSSLMVIYAAEVPLKVRIVKASEEEPFLGLAIPIDFKQLNEVVMKVFPNGVSKTHKSRAVYVDHTNPHILKTAVRIMRLIEQQEDCDLLVPLAIDEILVRLLRSPVGESIAQIGVTDSHASHVAKVIAWLKDNYATQIKMEDLADIACMSVSSFHTHFKSITAMSPLQFQKTLRLQEARKLIRSNRMDISRAAFEVGYASATQFSREYSREFGLPPSKDCA